LVLPAKKGSTLQHGALIMSLMASTSVYLISLSACVPGLQRCGFLTPPTAAALLRADVTTGAFCGARPPVERRAVCLVLRTRRLQCDAIEGARGIQSPCHLLCVSTHCSSSLLCTFCCSVTVTDFSDGD
jgi:hypothetical protein